jgi:hypothetical protein
MSGDAGVDFSRPITSQREYVRFGYSMCKPLLTSVPIKWTAGFHSADVGSDFDHLFLFHLAPCDYQVNLKKLERTRVMPWVDGPAGAHQRVTDQDRLHLLDTIRGLPRRSDLTFDKSDVVLNEKLASINRFIDENPRERHNFYMNLQKTSPHNELWAIPSRFKGLV